MGLKDDFLGKAEDAIAGNADKIRDGIETVGDKVDEKTGGKYTDQIDKAQQVAGDALDKLAGGSADETAEDTGAV